MNAAELQDRAVVVVGEARKLGAIDDVLIDPTDHRVGGFLLHGGLFHGGEVVPWAHVRSVGPDAVMVDEAVGGAGSQHSLTRLADLRGRKVVTDAGELAGTVEGLDFDPANGQITDYVVAAPGGGLFRSAPRYQVPPQAIAGMGENLMTIDSAVLSEQRPHESAG